MDDILTLLKERKTQDLIGKIIANPGLLDFQDSQGATLLMLSVYYGNTELKEFLLARKKSLSVFEASACGRLENVETITGDHPDLLNAFAPDGFTPLGLASFFSHENVVRYLLQKGADAKQSSRNAFNVAPLHSAAAARNTTIAKLLLEHGAEVDARQQQGFTPLHSAAHNGDIAMAELLLSFGADKKATTEDGKTPYQFAVETKNEKLMSLFNDEQ